LSRALLTRSLISRWTESSSLCGTAILPRQAGHPQQNGRHERTHLTLKKETTKPAGSNFLQLQAKFDDFIEIFATGECF
jgi:hypothetical protein